jgi:hypothetical protein
MARTTHSFPSVPSEFVEAIVGLASQAADRVTEFLHDLEEHGVRLIPLPRVCLLELGAALTLASWEREGILIHRNLGLPSAAIAIRAALDSLLLEAPKPTLLRRVLDVFEQRFAWQGFGDLAAAVIIEGTNDDTLVDALAQYLWDNRKPRFS